MAKVLLIDDEVTMVQMVAELLRSEGHEVFPFTSGNAALAAIESIAPELVITDLYLDKTRAHGFEILHKARSLNPPAVPTLPRRMTALSTNTTPWGQAWANVAAVR